MKYWKKIVIKCFAIDLFIITSMEKNLKNNIAMFWNNSSCHENLWQNILKQITNYNCDKIFYNKY